MRRLIDIAKRLRDPNQGCPWSKEQTYREFSQYLLSEVEELQCAVQGHDLEAIEEELGDCLWVLAFMINLGEERSEFTLESTLDKIEKKILYRHQYTLSGNKIESSDEAMRYYQSYKKNEQK